jgi:hypothetical protein
VTLRIYVFAYKKLWVEWKKRIGESSGAEKGSNASFCRGWHVGEDDNLRLKVIQLKISPPDPLR